MTITHGFTVATDRITLDELCDTFIEEALSRAPSSAVQFRLPRGRRGYVAEANRRRRRQAAQRYRELALTRQERRAGNVRPVAQLALAT